MAMSIKQLTSKTPFGYGIEAKNQHLILAFLLFTEILPYHAVAKSCFEIIQW